MADLYRTAVEHAKRDAIRTAAADALAPDHESAEFGAEAMWDLLVQQGLLAAPGATGQTSALLARLQRARELARSRQSSGAPYAGDYFYREVEAALATAEATLLALQTALFPNEREDSSYNLQGALEDIKNPQYGFRDGGVVERTLDKTVNMLERARPFLQTSEALRA